MIENIFEINDLSDIEVYEFDNSKIYCKDNFYKYPHKVIQYLNERHPPLWKIEQEGSRNTIDFEDRRHQINHNDMVKIYLKLSDLCGQYAENNNYTKIITNYTRFSKNKNNNYNDNYWWPHRDKGYNGIVYLNDYDGEFCGTNLYDPNSILTNENEHSNPWVMKKNYNVICELKSKFNRFFLFDGLKYPHSMNIVDDKWFADNFKDAEYRINQVFFFQP